MKINEGTLSAFATSHSDAPPDKEGWLWKRGEVNRVGIHAHQKAADLYYNIMLNHNVS